MFTTPAVDGVARQRFFIAIDQLKYRLGVRTE